MTTMVTRLKRSSRAGQGRIIRLRFAAMLLSVFLAAGPLFAQVLPDAPTKPTFNQIKMQVIAASLDNKMVAKASQTVRRADLVATKLLRTQIPRVWKRLKSRFIDPISGKVIWPRVIVLLVLLFLLWRLW